MLGTLAAMVEASVFWTVQVLTAILLAGLFLRGRFRTCPLFVLYLLVILTGDLLLHLGPRHLDPESSLFGLLGAKGFYSRSFWLIEQLAINLARFAVALELAFRTFRSVPGARGTARGVLFLLIAVTLVSVVAVTPQISAIDPDDQVTLTIGRLQPRVLNGTVWLLTGMAVLILWYRLPVDRFHKAILTGLVPYLLIFSIGLNAMHSYGWSDTVRETMNYVDTSAYLLLLAFWARAAWAPLAAPAVARGPAPALERQAG
jgi:hypothetical protein